MSTPAFPRDGDVGRGAVIAFFVIAFVVLAAGIGLRDPWPSDEPRFTLVAKTMVESGDWMFPRRGSELYSDKPPMMMWMEAAAYTVVREWRVAFLLPSLLAALGTLWLTFDLGRRLWSPRVGLYAAIGTLSAAQFLFQMKRAQIDPLITLWITLSLWGLLQHLLRGPDWPKFWLACFAAGLGVITKGVGFLPLLMLLPYGFARFRGWEGVARTRASDAWRWLAGGAFFLVAIALWLVPMLLAAKARGTPEYDAYVDDILFRQTAKRFSESWSHLQPVYYYVPIVLFDWFPLSLAYAGAIPRWWRALKAGEPRIALPLAWIVLVVIFFSIPDGKRDVYVMPAIPMLALCIAPFVDDMLSRRWLHRTAFVATVVIGVAALGLGAWAALGDPKFALSYEAKHNLADGGRLMWWMIVAIGAAFAASAIAWRPRRGVPALLTAIGALWLIWSFWAYPVLNGSSSASDVMRRAGEIAGPDAQIGLVAWKEQNLLMADRPMTDFGFKQPEHEQFARGVAWLDGDPARRWLFVKESAMGDCVARERARHVGQSNRRGWWLAQRDAIVPGCVPPDPDAEDDTADDGV